MSPLYSWLLVCGCLLAAVGIAVLAQAIRPAPRVELRGPESWRTSYDRFERKVLGPLLGLVLGLSIFVLGPWLDERAAQRDAARVTSAAATD